MVFMSEREIVKSLSKTEVPRTTIYLDQRRVDEYYSQRLGPITELARGGKLGGRIGADLFFLKSEVSSEKELSGSGSLTPVLKAILIESEASRSDQLADPYADDLEGKPLMRYIGDGRIVNSNELVAADAEVGLTPEMAQVIERERTSQAEDLMGPTIVWYAVASPRGLASICSNSDPPLNRGHFASYRRAPPFGILGRLEKQRSGVCFISPFWIWHEGN